MDKPCISSTPAQRLSFYNQIVCDPELTGKALAVAWRLVDRINKDTGQCNPSLETISSELSCNEKTVRRAIKQLIDRKWFSKEKFGCSGTQYNPCYYRTEVSSINDEDNRTALSLEETLPSLKVDTSVPKTGHTLSNEPSLKPVNKLINKPSAPSETKEDKLLFLEKKKKEEEEKCLQRESEAKMRKRIIDNLGGYPAFADNPQLYDEFDEQWKALSIYDCEIAI